MAGPSRHYQQQNHDAGRPGTGDNNALSASEDSLIQPENQLGIYPMDVHPWDERLNDEQRAANRFGLWFQHLMESDSGKDNYISCYESGERIYTVRTV